MDHVVPRSRGGRSSWDNVVTSCAPCNLRKGNRLPAEIGMHPRTKPRAAAARRLHLGRGPAAAEVLAAVPAAGPEPRREDTRAGRRTRPP